MIAELLFVESERRHRPRSRPVLARSVRSARSRALLGVCIVLSLGMAISMTLPAPSQAEEPAKAPTAASDSAKTEPPAAAPTVTPAYRKLVAQLLESIGAGIAGEQVAMSMAQETLGAIAAAGTPVTEEIQKIVVEEAIAEFTGQFGGVDYLTDLYAPLYAAHLSEKDIAQILAFYQSEAGQKMIAVVPQISQTAMYAIQQDSLSRIPDFQIKVDARLREAGIVIAP
jgi:hypothetical protein